MAGGAEPETCFERKTYTHCLCKGSAVLINLNKKKKKKKKP
jgi:hypothetical protein